jgi:hypothetical protein
MICASGENGMRSRQNGVRDLRKWCAQLAKWCAPHFENNGCPWENDVRVDVRVGVRVDVRYRARGACSAAHIIFKRLCLINTSLVHR